MADRRPSCPHCSAPLCQENQVMNQNISHFQGYYLTNKPLASWELGNHGRHCGNTLPWQTLLCSHLGL